jgi:hypothetical protein
MKLYIFTDVTATLHVRMLRFTDLWGRKLGDIVVEFLQYFKYEKRHERKKRAGPNWIQQFKSSVSPRPQHFTWRF